MKLEPMSRDVAALLKANQHTVAVSESSAAGLISAALLAQGGASAYFLGGGVVYTGPAREHFLGLPPHLPREVRSSSEPYAALMAATVRYKFGATWGLAETGAAGPTGNRYGDGAGHTCIAVSGPVNAVMTLETASDAREDNMWVFTQTALDELRKCIEAHLAASA